ncbi:molybdenum cofactor guanylyltransferase [Thermoactinomyces sp. CICC 10523]|uniref:molybdenum cofactor guanylyltransferase n=1 Tax=Thermoactinomyces sp. CICC 10523 TaxID=2767428 RepID=UPI0018DC8C22|nr:molybdenum cofactor guanylyltransferase [Thermoactinomyces sp. CICC 10523]MBH8599621.1 molybdenum cofactor guanylyltransferase [Thermoactinomyces sp. CICC 10523]
MLTGVILAGGQNRRMNGQVKALLPFGGEPLLKRQLQEMKQVCEEIWVVTNQPGRFVPYAKEGIRIISDDWPGMGPLGGMASAFSKASYPDVWVVGCDMPFICGRVAQRLVECRTSQSVEAVVPVVEGKRQPLHAVYDKTSAEIIRELLKKGVRQVNGFLEAIRCRYVDETFFARQGLSLQFAMNVNTPKEYERALRRIEEPER